MEIFSLLFDSQWRERGDAQIHSRYNQHYDSMAEQVMANRSEVAYLHSELNRVSQDLAQSMLLNRALLKQLLSNGQINKADLQKTLESVIAEHQPVIDPQEYPSRFCENCGRPLPSPGRKCPYCSEVELEMEEAPEIAKVAADEVSADDATETEVKAEESPETGEPQADKETEAVEPDEEPETEPEEDSEPEATDEKPKKKRKKSKAKNAKTEED